MRLSEARALVTGAAGGLGYRFALELARAGAGVAAVDVNADGLRQLVAEANGFVECGFFTGRVLELDGGAQM